MANIRVLLVDDEVEFLETLIKRMQRREVDVDGVGSGEEALTILQENPVDVVVVDVRMPDMDGIEVLREVKTRHPSIEVIMLTGYANIEVAVRGMELGAFDYLMKPIDIDELLYKIEDAHRAKTIREGQSAPWESDSRASV